MENEFIAKRNNTDLNLYQFGREDCNAGHDYGPSVRDHFLIHFILKGKGIFEDGYKLHQLKKGQGFLIFPGKVTYYQADRVNPWSYLWVGFHGLKAELYMQNCGLTEDNPVFALKNSRKIVKCLQNMIEAKKSGSLKEARLTGLLYLFISYLIEELSTEQHKNEKKSVGQEHISKAIDFISKNFSRKISVSDISDFLGLHRSYLYTIFKNKLDMSPQDYLIKYRINRACRLMENHQLTIGDIARSVGYRDPFVFSRIFKKKMGISPSKYRNSRRLFKEDG